MEKDKMIFKELKKRYNYLQDLGYNVLFLALQGSQNYGLDFYTETYKSDIDCMAIIMPSIDDIIQNKNAVSTTIVLENNEHINIKDIRLFFDLLYKQNPQYLELLFTKYRIINRQYKNIIMPLFNRAEDVAKYDPKQLYKVIYHMAEEKMKALEHPYPSIKEKIDKYGYDGKQLHHIIRFFCFLFNITTLGLPYSIALSYFDPKLKKECIRAKFSEFTLDEARYLSSNYLGLICNLKDIYSLVEEDTALSEKSKATKQFMDNVKAKLLKTAFTEELAPKIELENKICPDQYKNVWVTSDLHFGHKNILRYEMNRWDILFGKCFQRILVKYAEEKYNVNEYSNETEDDWDTYTAECINKYIEIHDEQLISNWNKFVGKEDLVFILGDFSFRDAEETMQIIKRLNGKKVLIRGNHDCFIDDKRFDKKLFIGIYDYLETKYMGQEIALMHYPILSFKHQNKDIGPAVLLFGHIHSCTMQIPRHSYNVGIDVNDCCPVNIKDAIQEALKNENGKLNGVEMI